MTITREQFDQWIDVLESGELPQCRGWLKRPHGYCCLGVAAEKVLNYPTMDGNPYHFISPDDPGVHVTNLWNETVPSIKQDLLIMINDGGAVAVADEKLTIRQHSFPEIAAFLRHKGYEWLITDSMASQYAELTTNVPEGFNS